MPLSLPWLIFPLSAGAAVVIILRLQQQRQREEIERMRIESELAATRRDLLHISQALASATDAIGIGDMQGTSLYHNQAHIKLFGYTVEALNAVEGGGVLFEDKTVAAAIHASIREGRTWHGETDIRTADGRVIPCIVRADCIRDENGDPAGIFGVFTNVADKKRTERILDEQRQRSSFTLRSMGDGVIASDADGKIELINPAAEKITGWPASEAIAQPLESILPLIEETTRAPMARTVDRLKNDPKAQAMTATGFLTTKTGAEVLVSCERAAIRDLGGKFAGEVIVFRDITQERRQAEDEARTGKLESLGLLAGGIAHDFNNLLTAMIGNIGVAQHMPEVPPPVLLRLNAAEKVAWRAKDLTQQLLTFAKGGTPQKSLTALQNLVIESVGIALQETTIEGIFNFSEDLCKVQADRAQLGQVFNNLAVNAVQAMPAGGRLTVSGINYHPTAETRVTLGDLPLVKISVSDTGTGIKPENLAKIFDPFFTTKKTGTGLGLATTYSVVRKHGGTLQVSSTLGVGTTFDVYLPAVALQIAETQPSAAREASVTVRREPVTNTSAQLVRVLLMDDNKDALESTALMVSLLGYEVVATANGADAVQAFETAIQEGRPLQIAILDIRVPDGAMNGLDTIKRLREISPTVRAVVASGYSEDAAMVEYRKFGFDQALPKPFKLEELRKLLTELMAL